MRPNIYRPLGLDMTVGRALRLELELAGAAITAALAAITKVIRASILCAKVTNVATGFATDGASKGRLHRQLRFFVVGQGAETFA
jgi:hypothetical protein